MGVASVPCFRIHVTGCETRLSFALFYGKRWSCNMGTKVHTLVEEQASLYYITTGLLSPAWLFNQWTSSVYSGKSWKHQLHKVLWNALCRLRIAEPFSLFASAFRCSEVRKRSLLFRSSSWNYNYLTCMIPAICLTIKNWSSIFLLQGTSFLWGYAWLCTSEHL